MKNDFSQAQNLAKQHPEKLQALRDLFDLEAKKNQVYPLSDFLTQRELNPIVKTRQDLFTFYQDSPRLPMDTAPDFSRRHQITAHLIIPGNKVQGTILALGSQLGGLTLYIKDGRIIYDIIHPGGGHNIIASSPLLSEGNVKLVYEFIPTEKTDVLLGGARVEGTGKLYLNDQLVGEAAVTHPKMYSGSFSIGRAYGSPVSAGYTPPFPFEGVIRKVEVEVF